MFVWEKAILKLLVGREGILASVTLGYGAFYFFLSPHYIGARVAPTTDPYPGIVELCGYSISRILLDWERLHLVVRRGRDGRSS